MKKITFILGAILFSSGIANAQSNGSRVSASDSKWTKGGIYEGYKPGDEILQKRSRTTKHFLNANGTITAQVGGSVHYQDQNGFWQDIDKSVKPTSGAYGFSNETNEIKSFFPSAAGSGAVKMKVSNTVALNWWKNPKLQFSVNGNIVKTYAPNATKGQPQKNAITYANVYPGVSEQFEILNGGLENNTIINSMNADMKALPGNAVLEFSQVIELGKNWEITANGKTQSGNFKAGNFSISIPGFEDGLTFSPIVVFDNTLTKQEAMYLAYAPKDKLTAAQRTQLAQHVFQSDYTAEFVSGGLKITTKLPASWLQQSGRSFPVTVDPTVTIGDITNGYFYGPMTHWYGFQRHADLYLQSEIGAYGNITAIEYYKTGDQASRTKPTKVFMRSTGVSTLTGTDNWNSATYTGGLTASYDGNTTQDATPGWKMITLTNSFAYTNGNLLVMVYDEYGGGGSAQYLAQTETAVEGRQAYIRADTTNPGDATATAVEGRLQTLRITYLNSAAPTITGFTPGNACTFTGSVVITGTDFSGTSSVTIGGTAVTSFVVNSATQITALIGSGTTGTITVTNSAGSATSTSNFTVDPSPVVAPIAGGAANVCIGLATPAFTNATAGGTWAITNGTGSATIDAGGIVTGVSAGNATITYTVSNATCTTVVNTTIAINGLPPVLTMTPAAPSVCVGSVQQLTASGAQTSGQVTIGAGTALTETTEEITAFGNRRQNLYIEMIFTAAELTAAGVTAGNISSVAFNVTTVGDGANNNNYTVKMGPSAATTFGTNFVTAGLVTVFGPATYTHAVGWNTITFATPYAWDGTSNIAILISHNGLDLLYNAQTYYTETTGNTVLWKYNHTGTLDGGGTASNRRLNTRFNFGVNFPVTWSPVTNLYTDAAGTIPYVAGGNTQTVYASPIADIQYTATATNTSGCISTTTANVTINTTIAALPTGASPQIFTIGQTLADLVVTGDNLHWYADMAGTLPLPATTVLVDDTTYYVTQMPTGQCESDLLPITADQSLSNHGFDNANFSYYPNPVKNVLNLSYNRNITDVIVFNLLGQQIIKKSINATEGQIDWSNLAAGTYLLKVNADNQTTTIKVVKQ